MNESTALRTELNEQKAFKQKLEREKLTAGAVERARIEIEIERADKRIRELEWALDALAEERERMQQKDKDKEKTPGGEITRKREKAARSNAHVYDVYISFAETEPDARWVWETLIPRLEAEGLQVAVAEDVVRPGVARVTGVEQGVREARRTLIVLTRHYIDNRWAQFDSILAQTLGWQEGAARVIPVLLESIDLDHPPAWIPHRLGPNFVRPIDLSPQAIARGRSNPRRDPWRRLVETLKSPLQPLFKP
ncbi:MAG: TIR domain-containing protein [Chloroflexi bacterium]|nr:TIR domain-containing protein [Chloroflexota bacterium]